MRSIAEIRRSSVVHVGTAALGEGMPKVCVPVMGASIEQIAAAAKRASEAGADLLELRIDSVSRKPDVQTAKAACSAAARASGLPILFTLRTARDGGPGDADAEHYEALLKQIARSGLCQAIDCELSIGKAAFERITEAAHEAGIPVVGSSHEFEEVREVSRVGRWMREQHALGADVLKAAVMAKNRVHALELALEMARTGGALGVPYIGIVMGREGILTRVACECLGSCLTFGTAGEASAPGQMDAKTLRDVLKAIHEAQ